MLLTIGVYYRHAYKCEYNINVADNLVSFVMILKTLCLLF